MNICQSVTVILIKKINMAFRANIPKSTYLETFVTALPSYKVREFLDTFEKSVEEIGKLNVDGLEPQIVFSDSGSKRDGVFLTEALHPQNANYRGKHVFAPDNFHNISGGSIAESLVV